MTTGRDSSETYQVDDLDTCYRMVLLDPKHSMVNLVNGSIKLRKGALKVDDDGISIQIRALLALGGRGADAVLHASKRSAVVEFAALVPRQADWDVVHAPTDGDLGDSHGLVTSNVIPVTDEEKRAVREKIIDHCSTVAEG